MRTRVLVLLAVLFEACPSPSQPDSGQVEVLDGGPAADAGAHADAGSPADAGPPDAGEADAGFLPDAGQDGGVPDGGPLDGGSADAGRARPDGGAWFIDGGVNDAGLQVLINVGELPLASSAVELPVTIVRGFTCDEPAVGLGLDVADVVGTNGDVVAIRPSGQPCNFHFEYWADGGTATRLSAAPSGYLIAAAASFGGLTIACGSDAVHQQAPGGPPSSREVLQVPVRCWAFDGTAWTSPLLVVPGDSFAAAWVEKLVPVSGMSGAFTLTWVRDSTFQFMNLSDNGRPPSDGVFEVQLTLGGLGLSAGAPVKVSSSIHVEPTLNEEWLPTPAELFEVDGLISLDAGQCPEGCVTNDGGTSDAGP